MITTRGPLYYVFKLFKLVKNVYIDINAGKKLKEMKMPINS